MDPLIPKWVSAQTTAKVATARIHQGMSTPDADWMVSDSRTPRNPIAPAAQNVANYASRFGIAADRARDIVLVTTLAAVPVLLIVNMLLV